MVSIQIVVIPETSPLTQVPAPIAPTPAPAPASEPTAATPSTYDSTDIKLITPTVQRTVTISVMHYFYSIVGPIVPSLGNCPTGSSFIDGQWFPTWSFTESNTVIGGGYPNGGMLYYVCMETYWTNDPYYSSLQSNFWTPCNTSPGVGETGECSIQAQKPPIVRVIAPIPPNVRESPGGTNDDFVYNVELWINNQSYGYADVNGDLAINEPGTSPTYPGISPTYWTSNGWLVLDTSATPSESLYQNGYNLQWELLGPTVVGGSYGKTHSSVWNFGNVWGTYYCGPWPMTVTPDLFGGTCIFECKSLTYEPGWFYKAPYHGSHVWGGDNWTGGKPEAYCSP